MITVVVIKRPYQQLWAEKPNAEVKVQAKKRGKRLMAQGVRRKASDEWCRVTEATLHPVP